LPGIKGPSDGTESADNAPVWARTGPRELDEAHEGTTVCGFLLPFKDTTVANWVDGDYSRVKCPYCPMESYAKDALEVHF